MSRQQQLKKRIRQLADLTALAEQQLATQKRHYGFSDNHARVVEGLEGEIIEIITQFRAAMFELMCISSHRQFMAFLREHGQ